MDIFFQPPPDLCLEQVFYTTPSPRFTQKECDDCTRTLTDIAILIILTLAVVFSLGTVLLVDEVKDAFSRVFENKKTSDLTPRSHKAIPKPTQRPDYWRPLATPLPTDEELGCRRDLKARPSSTQLLTKSAHETLLPYLDLIFADPQRSSKALSRVGGIKFFRRDGAWRVFTLTRFPNVVFKMYTNPRNRPSLMREVRTLEKARTICDELNLSTLTIPNTEYETIYHQERWYDVIIQEKLLLPTPGKQVYAMRSDSPTLHAPIKDLTTLMCEGRSIHFSPYRQSPLICSRAIGIVSFDDEYLMPLTEELKALHRSVGTKQKHIVEAVARSYGYTKSANGFINKEARLRNPYRRSAYCYNRQRTQVR
jgi:hypothetical protein